jgi:hypothetical protein
MDHFNMWINYFKFNPSLREHINYSQANIAYTIAAGNRGRGQRLIPFDKFVLNYKDALKTDDERLEEQIRECFGRLAKKDIKNG